MQTAEESFDNEAGPQVETADLSDHFRLEVLLSRGHGEAFAGVVNREGIVVAGAWCQVSPDLPDESYPTDGPGSSPESLRRVPVMSTCRSTEAASSDNRLAGTTADGARAHDGAASGRAFRYRRSRRRSGGEAPGRHRASQRANAQHERRPSRHTTALGARGSTPCGSNVTTGRRVHERRALRLPDGCR